MFLNKIGRFWNKMSKYASFSSLYLDKKRKYIIFAKNKRLYDKENEHTFLTS